MEEDITKEKRKEKGRLCNFEERTREQNGPEKNECIYNCQGNIRSKTQKARADSQEATQRANGHHAPAQGHNNSSPVLLRPSFSLQTLRLLLRRYLLHRCRRHSPQSPAHAASKPHQRECGVAHSVRKKAGTRARETGRHTRLHWCVSNTKKLPQAEQRTSSSCTCSSCAATSASCSASR